MELREYIDKYDLNIDDFADYLGICSGYMKTIVQKNVIPSKRLAYHIERLTKGEVKEETILQAKHKDRCPSCGHVIKKKEMKNVVQK